MESLRSTATLQGLLGKRLGLLMSKDHPSNPWARDVPFVVLGTADVGAMAWCQEKARLKQVSMEGQFAARAMSIARRADVPAGFCQPHPVVQAIEHSMPDAGRRRDALKGARWYDRAQLEETIDDHHAAFAAVIDGADHGASKTVSVVLVGVVDGVRGDGTVVEVTASRGPLAKAHRNGTVSHKQAQANIYAVMLGLPRWAVVLRCSDGREEHAGNADEQEAWAWIGRMIRLRTGDDRVAPLGQGEAWKCDSCECASECSVR